ncbi:MAG: lipocalin family protein [Cyclobacteriaceae bacterium]|nr:lipocalin family protein [Cyclobacteriaceae bacterium]
MKKLTLLESAYILVLLAAFACSKDEPTPSLMGTWKFASETRSNCTDPADNGTGTCTADCFTLTFTATSYTFSAPGMTTVNGTYTTSGNSITFTTSGGSSSTGTYTLKATTLELIATTSNGCTQVHTYNKQ